MVESPFLLVRPAIFSWETPPVCCRRDQRQRGLSLGSWVASAAISACGHSTRWRSGGMFSAAKLADLSNKSGDLSHKVLGFIQWTRWFKQHAWWFEQQQLWFKQQRRGLYRGFTGKNGDWSITHWKFHQERWGYRQPRSERFFHQKGFSRGFCNQNCGNKHQTSGYNKRIMGNLYRHVGIEVIEAETHGMVVDLSTTHVRDLRRKRLRKGGIEATHMVI